MNTVVFGVVEIVGYHFWPGAPDEVEFLRHEHRHIFEIKVGVEVKGLDRETEIFQLERNVARYLLGSYGTGSAIAECKFGKMSCEMIAAKLLGYFGAAWVSVTEDGRGGAIVHA
jgi:hypothetical protein